MTVATIYGTYDQDLIDNRRPMLPRDFDYRFNHYAHLDQIIDSCFKGDETIELARLVPVREHILLNLPNCQVGARYVFTGGRLVRQRLNLDGVRLDLRLPPYFAELTWRGWTSICPILQKIDI